MHSEQEPLSDADLAAITAAFGSCDIDGDCWVDSGELRILLRIMGPPSPFSPSPSARILGWRTAPFSLFLIPNRVPRGFTPKSQY